MISLSIKKRLQPTRNAGGLVLDVACDWEQGAFVAIYGKSGAGKTSVLRVLAGLMAVDEGFINVNGNTWLDTDKGVFLKAQSRKVGFVFQDYALFPHMTVEGNIKFALGKGRPKQMIDELMEAMELGELQHRKIETLSGGQKQRVALARALVQQPEILLLDEPLSALDHEMRVRLQHHIRQVHKEYGLTTILVSHDLPEIFKMADTVMVLDNGKLEKKGTPVQVFTDRGENAKFQFTGEIIDKERSDVVFILTILIGKDLVKVIAEESEAGKLVIGDRVLVASKTFDPIIKKID